MQKWLDDENSLYSKFNYIIINKSISYYSKLRNYKFGILGFQKRLIIHLENEKKFLKTQ
jgi:hypothetical protein